MRIGNGKLRTATCSAHRGCARSPTFPPSSITHSIHGCRCGWNLLRLFRSLALVLAMCTIFSPLHPLPSVPATDVPQLL